MINPKNDGIDHINVYSKGKTQLGQWLSNFAYSPFVHPEDGPFLSVEGYWYWLGCKADRLRTAYGFQAKALGRSLGSPDWQDDEEFKRKVTLAIHAKLMSNDSMRLDLQMNTLPLKHYYVYGGSKVVEVPEGDWILDVLRSY